MFSSWVVMVYLLLFVSMGGERHRHGHRIVALISIGREYLDVGSKYLHSNFGT
jgi:hypothetical protein